jgi:hydrogenase maturation factor
MRLDEASLPSTEWAADLASASLTLARRTAAGATLWCWAPRWPQHAEHLAVEFVHPVIVGARALPAEALTGPDPLASLRAVVEPGDVLAVIADAATPGIADGVRRAGVWGATTLWIGCGPRPRAAPADHLVWLDAPDGDAPAFDGRLVLTYHVLWELTHVCFEHPGLLRDDCDDRAVGEVDDAALGHCVTCADEGRLVEVVEPRSANSALVRAASGLEEVDTSLVVPVEPGELLLVHAGVALSRVEEADAEVQSG